MNDRIQQKYNNRIASLMGEIMDAGFSADLLKKNGLTYSTHEDDGEVRITEVEIGKGKTSRKFTLASYCDNRFCWHHDVFGSIAQLPVQRLKQIAIDLSGIVTDLVEVEAKEEKKSTRTRTPRKNTPRTRKPSGDKPTANPDPKENGKKDEKPPRLRNSAPKTEKKASSKSPT